MRYTHVSLHSFGFALPPRVVSSAALEDSLAPLYERLKLQAGRLEMISGVKERRFWEPKTKPSTASLQSAQDALQRAGVQASSVEALVHTSVSRDFLEPATASVVAGQLGVAPGAAIFDISNACLGFMNGIITIANMIELGQIEVGLVVASEAGEGLVEATLAKLRASNGDTSRAQLKSAFASLTIGSGSVAAVLRRRTPGVGRAHLLGGVLRQATHHHELCRSAPDQGFAGGALPLMETDAPRVLQEGCRLAQETWGAFLAELAWNPREPLNIFCHQVGRAHSKALFEAIGLAEGQEAYPTLESFGNMGSVSLPLSLALAAREERLDTGDRLALLGIGSGLNCVMLGLEWV